jgi:hypothetical protein
VNDLELCRRRLTHLQIAAPHAAHAAEVVASLAALQAQDHAGSLWAIGLRLRSGTLADVQGAVRERSIVRTWPMRGTLHFVAAADVHWLLDLLAAREIAGAAKRHRDLELDTATFLKAEKAFTRALRGGRQLTRAGMAEVLARAKVAAVGPRLYHCIWRLALEKVLCCGVPEGKQITFALLPEWVPPPKQKLAREEALAQLALRYFGGHGPAGALDLARWAGIGLRDARLGIDGAGRALIAETHAGEPVYSAHDGPPPSAAGRGMFLLPGFDEYILGYKDRGPFLQPEHADAIAPGGNGVFRPTIVHAGRVIGTWRGTATQREVRVAPAPFRPLTAAERRGVAKAAERYGSFLGKTARVIGA